MIDFLSTGNVIASETEEDIFRILGMFQSSGFSLWIVKSGQGVPTVPVVGRGRLLLGNRRCPLVLSVYWGREYG